MKRYPLLFILIFTFFDNLLAQAPVLFGKLTKDDGLSSNHVQTIFEDSGHFMWFGTENGLNRFNGYDFETYTHLVGDSTSLSNNYINCLAEDVENKIIWIGTQFGLNYIDLVTNKIHQVAALNNKQKLAITSLHFDKNNTLWVGTVKGLFFLRDSKFQYFQLPTDTKKYITHIQGLYFDSQNRMWVASRQHTYVYTAPYSQQVYEEVKHFQTKSIYSFFEDSSKNIWVSTNYQGIYVCKNGDINSPPELWKYCPIRRKTRICERQAGEIFIIVDDWGLIKYDQKKNSVQKFEYDIYQPNGISSKALRSIYNSTNGILWIGTFNKGVCYWNSNRKKFDLLQIHPSNKGLLNNNVRSIFEDSEGKIWIGTKEEGGLSLFDPKTYRLQHFPASAGLPYGPSNDFIFDIEEIDNNRLILGTSRRGVDIFDKRKQRFRYIPIPNKLKPGATFTLFRDSQKKIWLSSNNKLFLFDPQKETFEIKYKGVGVNSFCEEDSSHLWLGLFHNGVVLYNKEKGEPEPYPQQDSVKQLVRSLTISGLLKDPAGFLWIATRSQGVYRLEIKTEKFQHYTTENGLPSNLICAILQDNQRNIWISTVAGIAKLNTQTNSIQCFDKYDGLQGEEFTNYVALKSRTGEMYFGGSNGLTIFRPEDIKTNQYIPPVYLTSFKIFYQEVPVGEEGSPLKKHISYTREIILNHKQTTISFGFAALNYTASEANQYKYKLENFDKNWIEAGNKREALYMNLPTGEYIFKVKASNNDGIWNENPTSVKIIVVSPWWETWTFRIIAVLLFIAFLITIYYVRTQQLQVQKKLLEKEVTVRTQKLEKANFELKKQKSKIWKQKNKLQKANASLRDQYHEIQQQKEAISVQSNELEKTHDNLRLMSELGQRITNELHFDSINKIAFEYITSITKVDSFGIGLFFKERQEIFYDHFFLNGSFLNPFFQKISKKNSLSTWVLMHQKPIFIGNLDKEQLQYIEEPIPVIDKYGIASCIIVPLNIGSKMLGVLTIGCVQENVYTFYDLSNLQILASYIAIAIDNAHTYKTIKEQHRKITGNIQYAQTLQEAILPDSKEIGRYFEYFIIFKPKEIVSGDFYWFHQVYTETQSIFHFAVVDCTGHGVPGAIMSMTGHSLLNNIIITKGISEPSEILSLLDEGIKKSLKQKDTHITDGMDVCLVRVVKSSNQPFFHLSFSGAKRPLFYIRPNDQSVNRIKGTVQSIGGIFHEWASFEQHNLDLPQGTNIYLTSDGFTNQLNQKRKRYSFVRLMKKIEQVHKLPCPEQKEKLETSFNSFQSGESQHDDVTVMGIRL